MDSVPHSDPGASLATVRLKGELPSPINPPSGCRFNTRCPRVDALCTEREPVLEDVSADHEVACHHPLPASSELTLLELLPVIDTRGFQGGSASVNAVEANED
ncbi:oligopeptide/dipeptide ABC transporter ATP-binding protein [Rhodococcus sp. OK302]|uniref:oligopeptide/dipeptide ABC transporter ATP-binding protein n=1 Tax=Rhodococcus sp. OK302 TaxID=1882769 RepID=UPI000B943A76|nr:oligopeptide/dipeptide ABC transporter ATP-binding protein [Rhodococcus sp. OK302]